MKKIAIVGGGAAGFFSAITAARLAKESQQPCEITIYESSNQYLKKVKISGGGRCNVTHNLFEPKRFAQNYPRGQRELLSPFQNFQALDTVQWFKDVGINLVAEADGRMFPEANTSQAIIDCYMGLVDELGVKLQPKSAVKSIKKLDDGKLSLRFSEQEDAIADSVLICTGSSPGGYKLAESLGHTITERAPSLFSFKIEDSLISDLPGLSFQASLKLTLPRKKVFKQEGPILITHWGLSGPAILKLSAWGARELKEANYLARLQVNWMGTKTREEVETLISDLKYESSKSLLKNVYPTELPKRFWLNLLSVCSISDDKQWANLSKKEFNRIVNSLFDYNFETLGQNRYKDEFVECGGVTLKEVDFKTMESKICPGLYFAGELLDVDGITGGFNFQNAWTTGWTAAHGMVRQQV